MKFYLFTMPYRKKTYRTKFPRYPKNKSTALAVASKALKTTLALKRLVNVEKHIRDFQITSTTVSSAGLITNLSLIAQGDSSNERDGDQIKVLSISCNMKYNINVLVPVATIRMLLVEDKQTNGAQFTLADLLDDVSVNDGLVSNYNQDNMYRFNIVWDKVVTLATNGTGSRLVYKTASMQKRIRYELGEAGAVIAALSSSSYSLVLLSDHSANMPTVTFFCRVKYVDN